MTFNDAMPSLREVDHVRGPLSANLVLIAYGNYQCPQSGEAHRSVQNLRQTLGEQFCFAFRHFPMVEQYPQSQKTAETAEAAGNQGKFWQMHDQLFENQDKLDDASLVEYADALGLDVQQFLRELAQHTHRDRIREDVESGKHYDVNDTPTFFVSVKHRGNNIESLVQQILNAVNTVGAS